MLNKLKSVQNRAVIEKNLYELEDFNRVEFSKHYEAKCVLVKDALVTEFKFFKELNIYLKADQLLALIGEHMKIVRTFDVKRLCSEVRPLAIKFLGRKEERRFRLYGVRRLSWRLQNFVAADQKRYRQLKSAAAGCKLREPNWH